MNQKLVSDFLALDPHASRFYAEKFHLLESTKRLSVDYDLLAHMLRKLHTIPFFLAGYPRSRF